MKTSATFIYAFFISNIAISQDVITFRNGNEKNVKVIEVSPTEVKFKSFENIDGPLYTEQKSAIFMIKYENGLKDVFNGTSAQQPQTTKPIEKEITNYNYLNSPDAYYQNQDLIVTVKGDSIKCVIDGVYTTSISYHILKQGMDVRSSIPLANVSKFYNSSATKKEIVSVIEVPKKVEPSKTPTDTADSDEFLPEARRYGGPRMGATLVGPGVFRDMLTMEGKNSLYSQFGWQFEKRLFTTKTGLSAVVELVPMIGGIDMGKFIPSISGLLGIRTKKGIEIGAGPNAAIYGYKNAQGYYNTTSSFGIVIAAGMSFKSDKVYFPVNLAFIPSVGKTATVTDPSTGQKIRQKYETGAKVSLLVGFNYRKR